MTYDITPQTQGLDARKRGIRLADEIGHQPEPPAIAAKLGLTLASAIEPMVRIGGILSAAELRPPHPGANEGMRQAAQARSIRWGAASPLASLRRLKPGSKGRADRE